MQRQIPQLSEVLYVGLCYEHEIGTPIEVKIRRDMMDVVDMIYKHSDNGIRSMESGSRREGFRLKTSDRDVMMWYSDVIVVCDLSKLPPYHSTQTIILMECHDTPPGFAKLQLLRPTHNPFIRQSCISMNDLVYISSSLHREIIQNFIAHRFLLQTKHLPKLHGPCSNVIVRGKEYDFAYCFHCEHWPPPVFQWIDRCQRQGWPSFQVLKDIISEGFHLVAIGTGRSTFPQNCEIEWRMSFSQAEYKLVYSMNHTQFLCYGIMKIFMKEVLNVGTDDPLICSYFMKTAVFWKIQENIIPLWCPQNFLKCVWICFKYITQCVYRGELPNFFIPQNNMFMNKIHGSAQKQLFLQLLDLYNMGFSCLLLSSSIHQIITKIICKPPSLVCTDENSMLSEMEIDTVFFTELIFTFFKTDKAMQQPNLNAVRNMKNIVDLYLIGSSLSQFQIVVLQILRSHMIIQITFGLDKSRDSNTESRLLDTLTSATEYGFISDPLYISVYLYNNGRYTEALYNVERTKHKLYKPYVFHNDPRFLNEQTYIEAVEGQPLLVKVTKALPFLIVLNQFCFIDELRVEVLDSLQNCRCVQVPPLVMIHMLSFLCHHHLGDELRSKQSIVNLQALLQNDKGQYLNLLLRDISWQILGICKEICGDIAGALCSYQKSLEQFPTNYIYNASQVRIQNIISNIKSIQETHGTKCSQHL